VTPPWAGLKWAGLGWALGPAQHITTSGGTDSPTPPPGDGTIDNGTIRD